MRSFVLALLSGPAFASDHNEADGTTADPIADLADVYAWHTGGKIVVAVTFGGPRESKDIAARDLDDQVIYGVHIDTDGDAVADHDIWTRFGKDAKGAWGVQFTGIPGGDPVVEGPVATALDAGNGLRAQAGVFDDPFFFDNTGLMDTLATHAIAFVNTRDTFAGKNINALVFEIEATALGATSFKAWATTGRLP